jgi:hypothetical protein
MVMTNNHWLRNVTGIPARDSVENVVIPPRMRIFDSGDYKKQRKLARLIKR